MSVFILKLILAHILGDFCFQSNKWITDRNSKGIRSPYLYLHIGVHALLLSLLFVNSLPDFWIGLIIIIISHLFIDLGKIYLEKKEKSNKLLLFFIDQLLHFLVIFIVTQLYFDLFTSVSLIALPHLLLYAIAFLIITSAAPILLKLFFAKWYNTLKSNDESLDTDSLKDAGKYIGILERLLIVIFICINFMEGIGYLLAAKSIFRFGDLTNSKDKKLTEYILLGTLISFSIAVVTGLTLKELLSVV